MKFFIPAILILAIAGCREANTESPILTNDETVLFYGFNGSSDSISIFTMNIDGSQIRNIDKGVESYPAWYGYPERILTVNKVYDPVRLGYRYDLDVINLNHYSYDKYVLKADMGDNITFLKYSAAMNAVLFSYYNYGLNRIGFLDLGTDEIVKFSNRSFDERNPVCSEIDDWIYFSTKRESTFDIYRVRKDGSEYQSVIKDDEFDLTTFSVSADGSLLAAGRNDRTRSYLTVYKINTKEVLLNMDLSHLGQALYPSFTKDNKRILFVNGMPYDYETPRNIHVVNVDGSDYKQLTFYDDLVLARPLTW